jgi:TetR/AcrR family transcriptional regulator, transcriptional repressor for nem operon
MPRSTDPEKLRRLLDCTRLLLLRSGFGGVSVDRICREAGISKGGFFHHFKTKEEAVIKVARDFVAELGREFRASSRARNEDSGQRLLRYIDFTIAACERSALAAGCLIGSLTAGLPEGADTRIRAICRDAFTAWIDAFETLLQNARQAGLLPLRADTQTLASQFIALVEGSLLLRNVLGPEVLRRNLLGFRDMLAQMMAPSK